MPLKKPNKPRRQQKRTPSSARRVTTRPRKSAANQTERKRAEDALRQLNETLEQRVAERTEALRARTAELQITLDTAATGLVRNSRDLRYRWVNVAYAKLIGRPVEDITGRMVSDVLGADALAKIRPHIDRVLRGERVEFETELPIVGRGPCWIHVVYMPDRDAAGDVIGWVGSITDITSRKQVEEALRRQQANLEDLTTKLIKAQDSERQRIARDLHDDVMQRLAALTIDLQSLHAGSCESADSLSVRLKQLGDTVERLTTDLQRMAHHLHPSILEHLGLEAAVREHAEDFEARTSLKTELMVRALPDTIPPDHATCLYRVLQESLHNVRKHANATSVVIRLLKTERGIGLCVHDDGRGFEYSEEARKRNGLGLTSMEERIKALHGTFRIKTKPGDGTEIHAWVPLEQGDT